MEFRYDAYCGLYCGACPFLLATEQNRIAELAKQEGLVEKEITCAGCKSDAPAVFCRDCDLRVCARGREVEFCGDCADYPCDRLTAFRDDKHPHHSVVLKNLDRVREAGAAAWLAEQTARWQCERCGERFTWYDTACGKCGAPLFDSRAEDARLDA